MAGRSLHHRRAAGFTLLELALVLLLAAVLFSFALPSLPGLGPTRLESGAQRLAATLTYLADEASLRGRIYRVSFELGGSRWEVSAIAPYSPDGAGPPSAGAAPAPAREFSLVEDDPMAEPRELPAGVVFDSVSGDGGLDAAGMRAVYFLPEGGSEDLRVRLAEDGGGTVDVTFDAALGAAEVAATSEAGT